MRKLKTLLITILGLSFSFLLLSPASAQEEARVLIAYAGELVDQNAVAVSAVLPLNFKIYTQEKSKRPITSEWHFVSVVNGAYRIVLGEKERINSKASELWLGVEMDGKELVRQKLKAPSLYTEARVAEEILTDEIGKRSGENFSLTCPKGYYVIGIEGASAESINALRLRCAKFAP